MAETTLSGREIEDGTVTEVDLNLSDVTTGDVSTSRHGFMPKLPNDAAKFPNGVGDWVVPSSGQASIFGINVTIPTTGWSLSGGVYTVSVNIYDARITGSFTAICVITSAADMAVAQACELLPQASPSNPYLTFSALRVPTATITLRVTIIPGTNNYSGIFLPITPLPTDANITLTDVTTNNASTTKHGFMPKLTGQAGDVMRGDGTYGAVIPQAPVDHSPAAAATETLDLSASSFHTVNLPVGAVTLALSNAQVGQRFIVQVTQNASTGGTLTWFSTIRWASGITPTITATASKRDTFAFICTGSGTYDGFIVGQGA